MQNRLLTYTLCTACMVLMLLVSQPVLGAGMYQVSTATAAPASTPNPSATPGISQRPDDCERNDRREDACNLPLDAVSGPFTFLPEGDQDWYRVDLGDPNGLHPSIMVRTSGKLDLLVSISRDDGTPLPMYSSPAISTTLASDSAGPISIRVENRSPSDPVGSSYTIEVRKTLPPAPTPPAVGSGIPTLTPDIGENNWNPATAAAIAVGVMYDLNLTCPVSWGCEGGDHDYFAIPVKQGSKYVITTFDLGPGVDTVIDLFWGNEDVPLTTSDDYGTGMLSVVRWVAPANGIAIVRVGSRNGGIRPIATDKESGFYRFAVALAGTALERQLNERITQQGNIPTPTPRPAPLTGGGIPPVSGGPAPVPVPPRLSTGASNDAPKGEAVVIAESTALRESPDREAATIMTLPQETIVTLLGQASGVYVRVQPKNGVIPGWIRGVDLQLLGGSSALGVQPSATTVVPGAMLPSNGTATQGATTTRAVVNPLPTATLVSAAMASQRVPLAFTVQVFQSTSTVISGTRVQLVNAFGDILTEAVTPANGQVTLTRDIEQGGVVYVRIPAMGVQLAVEPIQTTLTIKVPSGGER